MQVSWIDPEEVAALAESLRLPARKPPAPAPEPLVEPVEPLVIETTQEPASIAAAANKPTVVDAVNTPNLAAFRERLQSIREKAIHAGLLTPKPAAAEEEAPPAEPAPAEAPAAEVSEEVAAEEPPSPEPEVSAPAPVQEQAPVQPEAPAWQPSPTVELAPPPPMEELGEDFEPAPIQNEAPVWAPSPAIEATPIPAETPAPAFNPPPAPPAPVYVPQPHIQIQSGASVKERLEAFAAWADQKWGQAELLVVDEYGDLLWGPPKKSGLVLSTMMAWNAAIRASAQAASGFIQTHQQILPMGETLTLIPCQTRLGMLQIAFVKMKALQEHETGLIQEALAQVMDMAD